jgi:hypothetical protein
MTIPCDGTYGYNWAEAGPDNPNGLGKLEDLAKKELILEKII